jgi:hypothetical protein
MAQPRQRNTELYEKALAVARAETAVHPGQCAGCMAWRTDGLPPVVHRHLCPFGPDGSQIDPLPARTRRRR